MISALIIDDEESNRNVLHMLVKKHCPELHIIDEAGSVDEAYEKIGFLKPRLIFLDIKMPQKNGFDLLRMFAKIDFDVIFVTAYDNYAIQAFEFNAMGYILKPINAFKLVQSVDRAIQRIHSDENKDLVLHFVNTISDKNGLMNKFSVHHNGKVVFIQVSEISFIESRENSTMLNLYDNTHYYSSKDLVRFEHVLQEIGDFIRINKNIIINTGFIKSYSKGEVCVIDLKSGQSFEVSRRRKSEILKRLKSVR
jgi:two-component system LytT family response regulator